MTETEGIDPALFAWRNKTGLGRDRTAVVAVAVSGVATDCVVCT